MILIDIQLNFISTIFLLVPITILFYMVLRTFKDDEK